MTLPPLSDTQKRAVEHAFTDALVTAGAGSGKTRVLTERFVHLVREEAVSLRRVAALTFTEKAAAQMRRRIADLFRGLGDESLRADVEFAPISTIHAFCALLLRQHAIEAGVDPSFQVLDAGEAALLREDAAVLAENRIQSKRPELVALFASLAGNGRAELLSLLERLRGAGRRPDEIVWMDGGASTATAAAEVRPAYEAYAAVGGLLPDELHWAHADIMSRVVAVLAHVETGEADMAPFACTQALTAVGSLKGRFPSAYNKARTALERALAALAAVLLDGWGARVLIPAMREVMETYAGAYAELKHERSALDFTDLELRARDLLRRAERTGRPLDLAPHALLVDEYQDTNPLQAEILERLRAHAPQFSVGDPKQSIYRFRRADVQVILDERERVGVAGSHAMNTSYRACPALVQGINALNARFFAGDRAGVVYEPLEAAATFLQPSEPLLDVAILDVGRSGSAAEGREVEAAWIAQRIEALTAGTTPRLLPRHDDAGEPTTESVGPLSYGDVALLFRAATSLAVYEAALDARGIPYLTQKSKGFFQAEEISDLEAVLRTVHNPDDRYALACTAAGPAVGAGDDDLLRWFGPSDDAPESAWLRMLAEAEAGGPHADAVRALHRLRTEAVSGSLARAVEHALRDLGLYETALLRPGGDRRAANLRKAVDLARRLDRGGRRGLADLLRHLETLRDRALGEAEAPIGGEADDVVRLTTVHGAKGLEYPVVFVPDVGRGRRGGGGPNILYDGSTSVAARIRDPLEGASCTPAGYASIAEDDAARGAQEEQRLLYVAMTRAEERLVLSGWCKGATKKGEPSSLTGWGREIWSALETPFEHGVADLVVDDARIRVHVIEGETVEVPEPSTATPPVCEPNPEARREAEALWRDATRSAAPLGDTRYVVSVSDLLAFADSPQRYYRERVVMAGVRAAQIAAWDAPPADADLPADGAHTTPRAERLEAWDEAAEPAHADRAAIGRAVHAVIEGLGARDETVPASLLERAVHAEDGDSAFAEAVREMAERFIRSATGRRLRAALGAGEDVRREVALHARIRFPGGEEVAGFDSLLVKGSIDLWLPTPEGVLVIDHKTNMAGGRFRVPADLEAHYAWQLRLYALAAERVLGADVAGARLLLLDPGWGSEVVEVEVDVGGEHLEKTRRLCRALALAEQTGRYPADWQMLLSETESER